MRKAARYAIGCRNPTILRASNPGWNRMAKRRAFTASTIQRWDFIAPRRQPYGRHARRIPLAGGIFADRAAGIGARGFRTREGRAVLPAAHAEIRRAVFRGRNQFRVARIGIRHKRLSLSSRASRERQKLAGYPGK